MVDEGRQASTSRQSEGFCDWRTVAVLMPEFVQWIVQRFGPLPDGEVRREDFERFAAEYEART